MARPRRSDHSRQLLLDAGVQMLTHRGYHGTGIKQVLDAVGVPKGSFYNYFPSKEAFVASVIHRYGEDTSAEFKRALEGHEQSPALLQLWYSFRNKVGNRQAAGESCACLLAGLSAEIAQVSPLCNQALAEVQALWLGTLHAMVRQAQQQGHIQDTTGARDLALLIFNCWQGGLLQYQVSADIDAQLHQLTTLLNNLATKSGRALLVTEM